MDLFNVIEARRSIKHYDPHARVTEDDFLRIMNAVLLSPTSYNIQHWRFIRVTDTAVRQQVEDAAWGQTQITQASELIVLCADPQAWDELPEHYWADSDSDTRTMMVGMMGDFYRGKAQLQRDEAIRSCGIAAQTLMLSAKALGYDTCPMIGFDEQKLAEIIALPQGYLIGMIITLGKSAQAAWPRAGQLPLSEVLKENRF
ncbi:MAG: nitroreductase family protein [Amphritea sp.]|nr:nitroreductase family protein [Amphritea sp.]